MGIAGSGAAARKATEDELVQAFRARDLAANALASLFLDDPPARGASRGPAAARDRLFASEGLCAGVLAPLVAGPVVDTQVALL